MTRFSPKWYFYPKGLEDGIASKLLQFGPGVLSEVIRQLPLPIGKAVGRWVGVGGLTLNATPR